MRRLRTLLAPVLALALSACGLIGTGQGVRHDVAGAWDGTVRIQGQVIRGMLTLTQQRRALEARFEAPALGLLATGVGLVTDEGQLQLELRYNLECPGVATLEGELEHPEDGEEGDARRVTGSIVADDCTGEARGRFTFERGGR